MSQSEELRGIGGWLAFLIVTLCLLHPVVGAYQGMQTFAAAEGSSGVFGSLPTWPDYKQSAWVLFAAVSALRIAAGVALAISRQRVAVHFTIAVVLLCPLLSSVGDWLLASHFLGQDIATSVTTTLPRPLLAFVWSAIWIAYLLRSVRVRNTYPSAP